MKKTQLLVIATGLMVGGVAQAKDLDGKLGFGSTLSIKAFGVGAGPSVPATINVRYWLGDLAIEAGFGLSLVAPDGGDAQVGFAGGAGVLYNFAKFENTNVGIGAKLMAAVQSRSPADPEGFVFIQVPLRAEHFLDDHFSLNASVGLDLVIDPDNAVQFETAAGLLGLLGFSAYF